LLSKPFYSQFAYKQTTSQTLSKISKKIEIEFEFEIEIQQSYSKNKAVKMKKTLNIVLKQNWKQHRDRWKRKERIKINLIKK
jgi:hypothetical protein